MCDADRSLNVLLIRLRLIGDVVFTTPAIRAVRQCWPAARISYLVEPAAAPVVARNPHLDHVHVIARTSGLRRVLDDVRWAGTLRRRHFDVVVDFHGGPRSAWLTRATGAPRRIGYATDGRRRTYTEHVARARELRPRHSVENQWDLIRGLCPSADRDPDPRRDPVEMPADPQAAPRLAGRLARHGLAADNPLVVVHVSAGNPFRRWPEAAFVTLAAGLAARDTSRRIILTGGPSDHAAAARVAAEARRRLGSSAAKAVLDWDDLGLAELHSLLSRAALFVGGDSGPLHVAATTSVPIVGIYGPTLAERSSPWRDPRLITASVTGDPLPCRPCEQRRCLPGDFRCLTAIPAARVLESAERILADPPRAGGPLE
jgi:ADP-heptose:LPS heptosyltransferase